MKVAIYARVSTAEQTTDNQVPDLERFAVEHGAESPEWFKENESAWREGHQKELARFLGSVYSGRGKYDGLVVWSLDRLTRGGPLATLQIVHALKGHGCRVYSVKEPWLNVEGPFVDLLYSIIGYINQFQSTQKSQAVKAGQARAVREGKQLGRPLGRKDNPDKPRRRAGYFARYANKHPRRNHPQAKRKNT